MERKRVVIGGLVVLAATAAIYWPALFGDWLGDDRLLILDKSCARSLSDVWAILTGQSDRCYYRPIRYVSYAFDHILWGMEPLGYHITNLWLHVLSTGLVFLLLRQFGLRPLYAALGCAFFALHPVQVDSVGYIAGRRDVLMGLWYFAGVYCFGRGLTQNSSTRERISWLVAALVATILCVLTKEMGVTIVAIFVALLLVGGVGRMGSRESTVTSVVARLRQYSWFIIPAGAACALMILHRGIMKPVSSVAGQLWGESIVRHLATVFAVHAKYVELIFFPVRLTGDYSPPVMYIPQSLASPASLLGMLWIVSLVVAATWAYRKGWQREAFGAGWYLVTMLPVSQIIPHHELVAEHYLYVPLFGLLLAGTSLLERLAERADISAARRRALLLVALTALVALGVRSHLRSYDYRDDIAHARATVLWYPESVRGQARLGIAILNEDGLESARPHLEFVLSTDFQGSARLDVLRVLGRHYADTGRYELAEKLLGEYVASRPHERSALEPLASTYIALKKPQAALRVAERLQSRSPEVARFHYLEALARYHMGQPQRAKEPLERALGLDEDHLDSLLLASNLHADESPQAARAYLERARVVAGRTDEIEDRQLRLLELLERRLPGTSTSE